MTTDAPDEENILFKEKKVKDGWVLNMVKQNDVILSTSLYDSFGQGVDDKTFLVQNEDDVHRFKEYLELFDSGPEKNHQKMINLQ